MTKLDPEDLAILGAFGTGPECERHAERAADRAARREDEQSDIDAFPKRAHQGARLTHKDQQPVWQIPDDVPLFTMATVSRAADVAPPTIRAWFQRKHARLKEGDTKAHLNGLPNKFTLRSVMMLAVTSELVRLGSLPGEAFKCAEHWMGDGAIEGQVGAVASRDLGGLFAAPLMTYLVVGADGVSGTSQPCRIEGIDPHDPKAHSAFFNALFFRGRSSAKIVLLNMVDRRVRQVCQEAVLGDGAPPEPDWEAVAAKLVAADNV